MQADKTVAYRFALAKGFLSEAEQDIRLGRWRACVSHAQLAVENAGKAVLATFGVPPKTHDPARQLAAILQNEPLTPDVREAVNSLLPDLLALGSAEHFLTDYGDEGNYVLPWELFNEDSAEQALSAAQRALSSAKRTIERIAASIRDENDSQ